MHPNRFAPASVNPLYLTLVITGIALGLLLISCGNVKCIGDTPVPKLSSVSPTTIESNSLPVSLTLSGSGFVSWSTVYLNSVGLTSGMIDSHHLSATVTWQNLSALGVGSATGLVTVVNAGQLAGGIFGCPNGGTSQPITVIIN